ncbi:hypothetical protein [Bacillus sp. SH5-2]|uniref:hypothetical protein n=1 Tax=Bacillus sp. SH5-2 TaxID=2217834 RepID=UPI0011EEF0F5|nr:hypothetical protein [Bacillus sp. SH5-2]KAA0766417.1 hypothetical protein DN410_02985 [Bacillus sp. SH5-2]
MSTKTLADFKGYEGIAIQVKFTKPEYLEGFLDGKLFMNNFKYFIDLEKEKKEKGQGDKLEAGFVFRGTNITLHYEGKEIGKAKSAEVVERYSEAEKLPIFCLARFESKDLSVVEESEDGLKVKIQLSKEDQEAFLKDFGPIAVVLPGDFYDRIYKTCKEKEIESTAGKVAYLDYDYHDSGRKKLFDEGSVDMFFWKDDFFRYQRECRIVLTDTFVEENLVLEVGSLRDKAIVLDTKEFFENFIFDVNFEEMKELIK